MPPKYFAVFLALLESVLGLNSPLTELALIYFRCLWPPRDSVLLFGNWEFGKPMGIRNWEFGRVGIGNPHLPQGVGEWELGIQENDNVRKPVAIGNWEPTAESRWELGIGSSGKWELGIPISR